MILSTTRNFVYLKTRKTAGTSIEALLRETLGSADCFVTQKQLCPGNVPFGAEFSSLTFKPVSAHMSAQEITQIVDKKWWASSFKFTSERHPYEKAVSLAFYNYGIRKELGKATPTEFSKFLNRTVRQGKYRSFDIYSIDGKAVVDDFVRYETLEQDMARICERLKIPRPSEFPIRKSVYRIDRRPAREILSVEQRSAVFNCCREEFSLLGYKP